jgi:hypothetical protein
MATHKEREMGFYESMKDRSVRLKGMFLGMRSKALFECLVCSHEWEAEPRDVMAAKGSGCKKCAIGSKRKPNLILEDDGLVLKIDISQPSKPGAFMLINKSMWNLLKREIVNRVWPSKKGYPWVDVGGSMVFVHRFIMGFPQAPEQVDHINGVKWDNRTSNLRVVTALENQMNRGFRKTNTSGVIGVSFHKGRWEAKLCVDRKVAHKSRHDTKEAAVAARAKAVAEHCGEFAPIGSFREVIKEDPLRVLDGSKWVDAPAEDFSRG